MSYIVFKHSNSLGAIPVSMVKEIVVIKDVKINDLPGTQIKSSVATIRSEPLGLIDLDRWLGYEVNDQKLIIKCFLDEDFGILVADVIDIIDIDELKEIEGIELPLPKGRRFLTKNS